MHTTAQYIIILDTGFWFVQNAISFPFLMNADFSTCFQKKVFLFAQFLLNSYKQCTSALYSWCDEGKGCVRNSILILFLLHVVSCKAMRAGHLWVYDTGEK